VEYTYHRASPGTREAGTGLLLSPNEPAMLEIETVTNKDGDDIERQLPKKVRDKLEEWILEKLAAEFQRGPED
jgi:hypothetical protein